MAKKRSKKRATEKARKLASELMSRFFYPLDEARSQYVDRWVDLYKRYEGFLETLEDEEEAWKTRLPDFFTYPFVQAMTAYMHQAFFGTRPYISIDLMTHGMQYSVSEEDIKNAIEETINQQFDESGFSGNVGILLLSDANLYGTSIAKVYWKKDEVEKVYLTPAGKVTRAVPVFDGPFVEPIKLWDFWIDPMLPNIKSANVVIYRQILDIDNFYYLQAQGFFEDVDITPISSEDYEVDDSNQIYREVGESTVAWQDPNKVEILEVWVKGYGKPDEVYYIANRRVVVRQTQTWLWSNEFPFVEFRPVPVTGKFYGLSPIWVARGAIDEVMTHKRIRLDNIKLHLVPMFKVRGTVNPDDLKVRPNGLIFCETRGDDVEPFRCQYVGLGVPEEEALVQMIQFILGFSELMAGLAPQTSMFRTALGASTFAQVAFGRLGLIKSALAEGIASVASKFIELDYQYLTEPLKAVMGDAGRIVIEPEVLRMVKKLHPVAALDPNKQISRQTLINFLQVISQTPLAQRLPWDAIWKEIAYAFDFQDKASLNLLPPQLEVSPQVPQGAGGQISTTADLQAVMRQIAQGGAGVE